MTILGLHPLDLAIVLAAMAAILFIGAWVSRGVDDEADFFVGGRSLGPILQFFLNFGMMTDSSGAPTVASEVYRVGAAGMWIPFQPLFCTPFYWFTCIWWRRTRLITAPDQFIERFNSRRLATAAAWWAVLLAPLMVALGNLATYKVAAALFVKPESAYTQQEREQVQAFDEFVKLRSMLPTGQLTTLQHQRLDTLQSLYTAGNLPSYISYIQPLPFYVAYTLIVAIYVVMGGIKAAAYTDAFQGILIIIFSVILIPVGLWKLHGISAVHQRLPEFMFRIFGSSVVADTTWYSILAFVLLGIVTIGTPAGCGSGKNETALRIGVLGGGFSKRLTMICWMYCGLIAAALFPGRISDPDNTWGVLSRSLLGPGLLGIMISGILLGHMPAVGKNAVDFSATFTRNLYQPLFPGRSERHYMLVARGAIVLILAAGVMIAMSFSSIIELFTTTVALNAFLGTVGVLMLFWRRLTAFAVGTTWIAWVVLMLVGPWLLPLVPGVRTAPLLLQETRARHVMVYAPATRADVDTHAADKLGQTIRKPWIVPPKAIFFESIGHVNAADPASPSIGLGRFNVENFCLYCMGIPLRQLGTAGLKTCTWLFDALSPAILLMTLSYLPIGKRRRERNVDPTDYGILESSAMPNPPVGAAPEHASGLAVLEVPRVVRAAEGSPILDPVSYARIVMRGNIALTYNPDETAEQEQVRLDRYFAKFKTPVAANAELEEMELAETFRNPRRYDSHKLFPNTQWEFTTWHWSDWVGFSACWVMVGGVLAILWLVLNMGA